MVFAPRVWETLYRPIGAERGNRQKMEYQKTLKKEISLTGIGLHSGEKVTLRLNPAPVSSGIVFKRVDLSPAVEITAEAKNVVDTTLATVLGKGGATVSTVEHCLAALYGMGVDNALVEVDGPEIPILDGSAHDYVRAIARSGLVEQSGARKIIRVEKPIRIEDGDKFSILRPFDGFRITYSIDFNEGFPGEQHYMMDVNPGNFADRLCRARTFGFVRDVELLKKIGKARGASLENAVALDQGKVLNPEGLRMPDELVRHKMLDAVGDLALAGCRIQGHLIVHKGGHELHRRLVGALLDRTDAWTAVTAQKSWERRRSAFRAIAAAAYAHA